MATPIELFDYYLPKELIAKYPSPDRDQCRLMTIDKLSGEIAHKNFSDLVHILSEKDFLVVNNTKVRKARLEAFKPTGGKSELLVTDIIDEHNFKTLVKGRFKYGDILHLQEGIVTLIEKDQDGLWLAKSEGSIINSMSSFGHMPLPPYIDRPDEVSDNTNYQTVYAKLPGSAAAPTAGLHFTAELIEKLKNNGVEIVEITLDVGLGTFRPVKTPTVEEHVMHGERYEISSAAADKINSLKSQGKNLVAVGSTVLRTLETAIKDKKYLPSGADITHILISPPYEFKVVDAMLTNFHLPKSTLMAMVSAFGGHRLIMKAYETAIENRYRFFSYGDAMLIKPTIV